MKPCKGTTNKLTGNSVHTLVRLHSTLATEASHLYHSYNNKILWTRKNTVSCARQELKHLRSYSPQVHYNGCTEQQRMMTAGKSATSHFCRPLGKDGTCGRYGQRFPPTAYTFSRSGTVFRKTAIDTMEHWQEAHPPPVGRTDKPGTHRHLPFKGSVRNDIPVPVAVDGKGWQRSFQPVHSQTKGKDRTALNGDKRADWLIFGFSVVPLSASSLAIVCLFTGERKRGMA